MTGTVLGQADGAQKSGNPGKLRHYPEKMPSPPQITRKRSIWVANRITKIVAEVVALRLG